jgi:bifunctional NMN adenylyltransferase/nudix hydrolase
MKRKLHLNRGSAGLADITTNADVAVLIGRFQPFHNGHDSLLRKALDTAPKVVIILGSSFHARSAKNPFTWQERSAIISASLAKKDRQRVLYIPVRDYYHTQRWAHAVTVKVTQLLPNARHIALIGYFKDSSSDYLNHFPLWKLVTAEQKADIDATRIRRVLFEAENIDVSLDVIADMVPTAVRQYLKAWTLLSCYPALVQEYDMVKAYKAAWQAAPYPPVFTTVDAVVKTAGHILLIRRGDFPGKGLWALPGGFLEQHEQLLQGAIRELSEETGLGVLIPSLIDALAGVAVFDHPDRSLRGRTITHAHFFDLKTEQLPSVKGADDAAEASWVPIENISGMEDMFFDDHFHILDHFLGVTKGEDISTFQQL